MSAHPLGNDEIHARIETIKTELLNGDRADEKVVAQAALDLVGSTLKTLHNIAHILENLEIAIRNR